jgi:hypothetical protein
VFFLSTPSQWVFLGRRIRRRTLFSLDATTLLSEFCFFDYSLKDVLGPIADASDRLLALKGVVRADHRAGAVQAP